MNFDQWVIVWSTGMFFSGTVYMYFRLHRVRKTLELTTAETIRATAELHQEVAKLKVVVQDIKYSGDPIRRMIEAMQHPNRRN